MTYRDYLIALLKERSPNGEKKCVEVFRELFGCVQISSKECMKHIYCAECYACWLESEVPNNENA